MTMARARSIDAEQGLILRERAGAVELVAGNVVLLSSAALQTERAFGRLAALASHTPGRVLVGGLGFGATLRGALDVLGADARVRVAEKVPAVEALVRGELAHLADRPLDDPRACVEHVDVGDAIASARGELDAILLDVDNGPHWATFRSNARLYGDAGLAAARRALAPGGVLAVWSGYPADQFAARLRAAGFSSRIVPLHEGGRVRARAYVGTVPPAA
jgi:spermidine synthase